MAQTYTSTGCSHLLCSDQPQSIWIHCLSTQIELNMYMRSTILAVKACATHKNKTLVGWRNIQMYLENHMITIHTEHVINFAMCKSTLYRISIFQCCLIYRVLRLMQSLSGKMKILIQSYIELKKKLLKHSWRQLLMNFI